jgi:hypothetical protein
LFLKKWFFSGLQLVFSHIFKIKFIEVGEPAVPAPHDKVPAADGQVVRTGNMAVPAFGRFNQFPEIITTDLRELPLFTDILDPGNEDPGCAAVIADYLRLERNCPDNLVGIFPAMITVRAVPGKDETFAHRR